MDAVESIRNYRQAAPSLGTSGQPNEEQLRAIAAAGYEIIINLALHDDPRYSLADEAGSVAALGLHYIHIPVRFEAPSERDLFAFFDAMQRNEGRRVWVHCAANMRVTAFLALYRCLRQGWPEHRAFALLRDVWQPNPVWAAFIAKQLASCRIRCLELGDDDIPRVQRFFEDNPEYHLAVMGTPPAPDAAREEFESLPPPDWHYRKRWRLQFVDGSGTMVALADVIEDLLAEGVWHVGLFVVATALHGTGTAHLLYERLESWMRSEGARWLRLGVVAGNARAERFWQRVGYTEVRQRHDVAMGERVNTLRVMVKPLTNAGLGEYHALVSRDRPDGRKMD